MKRSAPKATPMIWLAASVVVAATVGIGCDSCFSNGLECWQLGTPNIHVSGNLAYDVVGAPPLSGAFEYDGPASDDGNGAVNEERQTGLPVLGLGSASYGVLLETATSTVRIELNSLASGTYSEAATASVCALQNDDAGTELICTPIQIVSTVTVFENTTSQCPRGGVGQACDFIYAFDLTITKSPSSPLSGHLTYDLEGLPVQVPAGSSSCVD